MESTTKEMPMDLKMEIKILDLTTEIPMAKTTSVMKMAKKMETEIMDPTMVETMETETIMEVIMDSAMAIIISIRAQTEDSTEMITSGEEETGKIMEMAISEPSKLETIMETIM